MLRGWEWWIKIQWSFILFQIYEGGDDWQINYRQPYMYLYLYHKLTMKFNGLEYVSAVSFLDYI